jgi:hypothetical protein
MELAVCVLFFAALTATDSILFGGLFVLISLATLDVGLAVIGVLSVLRAPNAEARSVGLTAILIAVIVAAAVVYAFR